ncbi:MAG: hypothetical protein ABWY38_02020 [Methyloceanibacter sp.]|jgi:predicted negative regulator of RcsB-dependent stress response
MKSLWFVIAMLLVATVSWLAWGYYRADNVAKAISDHLPSHERLDAMSHEETEVALKIAMSACTHLQSLQWNPLARLMRGDAIAMLAEHCELLEARQQALSGP